MERILLEAVSCLFPIGFGIGLTLIFCADSISGLVTAIAHKISPESQYSKDGDDDQQDDILYSIDEDMAASGECFKSPPYGNAGYTLCVRAFDRIGPNLIKVWTGVKVSMPYCVCGMVVDIPEIAELGYFVVPGLIDANHDREIAVLVRTPDNVDPVMFELGRPVAQMVVVDHGDADPVPFADAE
jgi:dUTPase